MKKHLLIIVTLLLTLNLFSQTEFKKATILLKDSTEISGLAKITGKKIKFKKNSEGEKTVFDNKKVLKLIFGNGDVFRYKTHKGSIVIVKELVVGKVSLYSNQKTPVYIDVASGTGRVKSSSSGEAVTTYFLSRGNENTIKKYDPMTLKQHQKFCKDYFINCEKFKNLTIEDISKLNGVTGLVKYYNENCN